MPRCAETCESWVLRCCGSTDLDDIFSYSTNRVVLIRDRRLGIAALVCAFGVIVYVLVQLLYHGEYLASVAVEGTVRLSVAAPRSTCSAAQRSGALPPPPEGCRECDPDDLDCFDRFGNTTWLPYCEQYIGHYPAKHQLPCRYEEAANTGLTFQSSVLLGTVALVENQTKNCSARPDDPLYSGGTCDKVYVATSPRDMYFYADVESFWVLISHAVRTADSGHVRSSIGLEGKLRLDRDSMCAAAAADGLGPLDGHGREVTSAPCFLRPNYTDDGRDFFSLKVLLDAAGITLDDPAANMVNKSLSARLAGVTLLITITYTNWKSWELMGPASAALPRYEYSASALPTDTHGLYDEAIYERYPVRRTLLQRSGVRVVALQCGTLREFDAVSALITVTTALALITVSVVVVDFAATQCMPGAALYRDYKRLVTPDMSDVRDGVQCATCSEALATILVEDFDGEGHCGVCDQDVPPGSLVYRCTNCPRGPVDRCAACLVASTINRPAVLNLRALVLASYDTNHDGLLSFDEYECLLADVRKACPANDCKLRFNPIPAEQWEDGVSLAAWLRGLSDHERDWLRKFLRPTPASAVGSNKWTPAVAFLRATMRIGDGHDMLRVRRDEMGRTVRTIRSMRSLRSARWTARTRTSPDHSSPARSSRRADTGATLLSPVGSGKKKGTPFGASHEGASVRWSDPCTT